MRSFLAYVVNEALEGRSDRIKSFTISVEVFGRSADKDASGEAVVRTTANRLRAALDRYYSGPGLADPVIISLPKGRYIPQFTLAAERDVRAADSELVLMPAPSAIGVRRGWLVWLGAAAMMLTLVAAAAGLTYQSVFPYRAPISATRIVIVPPEAHEHGPLDALVVQEKIASALVFELHKFGTTKVATVWSEQDSEQTANDDVFLLNIDALPAKPRVEAHWRLTDARTGGVVWAGQVIGVNTTEGIQRIAGEIAAKVLGPDGAVPIMLARLYQDTRDIKGCLSTAQRAAVVYADIQQADTSECLESLTRSEPRNAAAWALLAATYFRLSRNEPTFGRDPVPFAVLSREAAAQAEFLAPTAFLTRMAQFYVAVNDGNTEAFQSTSQQILAEYGQEPNVKVRIGNSLFSTGRFAEGLALIKAAIAAKGESQGTDFLSVAWGHYLDGDYEAALEAANRLGNDYYYMVHVARAAILGELGRTEEAAVARDALLALRPDYGQYLYLDFGTKHTPKFMIDALAVGLRKAGLDVVDYWPPTTILNR